VDSTESQGTLLLLRHHLSSEIGKKVFPAQEIRYDHPGDKVID